MLSTVGLGNDSDPDHAVAMDGSVPTDEMKKAFGDSLYLRGEKEQAEKVYKDLMKTCRNGLFYNDIIQKVNIDPIPLEEEEKYVPDSINKIEKMLIDEIVDICRDNDIKYVLGPHLSRRLFICGNFGYEDEKKNIYMDAENAQKFINAFEKINGESRALLSWLNNSKINDMVLKYVFTDSVLLDPYDNQINSERLGVNINIIIIRSGMADKNYRRVTRLKEHAVHNTGLLSRAGLFRQIMKKEPGYKQGNYYFFTNSKGEKPLRRKYHDEDWNEVGTIEYEGRTYAVPKAALDVYFRNEVKKSNKRKETDISQYWFTSVSWDELDGFDGNLGVYAERLVELNNKKTESNFRTDVFWKRMLCVNDSMRINDKYAGSIEEMERALAEGAYDHLGSLLTEVNELACMYIKRNVYLDIDERIWNCYVGFLEGTGQHKLANKMKAKEEIK